MFLTMPYEDFLNIKKKIKPVQDIAIMLSGASEFLCEKRMLKRLSAELEASLYELESITGAARQNSVIKTTETKNLDNIFSNIRDLSGILKSNNADLEEMCASGDLGKNLTASVSEFKNIINNMEKALLKKNLDFTAFDRIIHHSSCIKSFFGFLFLLFHKTLKIIFAGAILAICLFAFLFFTMESKDTLIKDIKIGRANLEGQMAELEQLRSKYRKIADKIESVKENASTRHDKIVLLELITEKREIQGTMDKTLLSIKIEENKISEKNKKLEEINGKSFLHRLLRR